MPNVPCSQCSRNIAEYFPGVKVGICNSCQKVFCKSCLGGFRHQECPLCHNKLFITERMKMWPFGNQAQTTMPPMNSQGEIAPQYASPTQPTVVIQQMQQPQPTQQIPQKVCKKCGNIVLATAKFCDKCGKNKFF